MKKTLTDEEIERRKLVWTALSELWLDTEINEPEVRYIADTLARSGYTISKLREIYLYEVAPVVSNNLLTVAGVWEGFDLSWLHAEARKRAERRKFTLKLWVWLPFGRGLMTYATEKHWLEIVHLLNIQASASACEASRRDADQLQDVSR